MFKVVGGVGSNNRIGIFDGINLKKAPVNPAAVNPLLGNPDTILPGASGKFNLTFRGKIIVPNGYEAVECGFVFTNQDMNIHPLDNFVIGGSINGAGVIKKAVSSTNIYGEFAFTVTGVAANAIRAMRAFLIYRNIKTGDMDTTYSKTASTLYT